MSFRNDREEVAYQQGLREGALSQEDRLEKRHAELRVVALEAEVDRLRQQLAEVLHERDEALAETARAVLLRRTVS